MKEKKVLSILKIETERLMLRALKQADAPEILKLRSDEQVQKYLDRPKMNNLKEAEKFIDKINTGIAENQWLYWGICQKSSNNIIGTICIWQFVKQPFKADIGYELLPEYQSLGIMSEALKAIIDHGFRLVKLEYLEGCTNKNNLSSIKLLEKNNFTFVKELSHEEKLDHEQDSTLVLYSYKNDL